jgi:SWIM/SEC-C metal-binding protein
MIEGEGRWGPPLTGCCPRTLLESKKGWCITREIIPDNQFNGDEMEKTYDGQKDFKLGTKKNPAVVYVQTKRRMKKVASIFEEHGWEHIIELDKSKPEDITDLEVLLNTPKTVRVDKKVGRNDPCPCGSGMKYKKCCGK